MQIHSLSGASWCNFCRKFATAYVNPGDDADVDICEDCVKRAKMIFEVYHQGSPKISFRPTGLSDSSFLNLPSYISHL
jgi:hypothetical protein